MEGRQRHLGLTRGPGLTRGRVIGLGLGLAALATIMVRAGAGAVMHSFESLGLTGLIFIILLHLPPVAAMGYAWQRVAGSLGGASFRQFVWARLVRDGAAEALPFSQVGSFVFGLRALRLEGREALPGAISMGVDLTIELAAKLPYMLGGLLVLLAFAPDSKLLRPILLGLGLTAAAVAVPLFARRQLWRALESAVRAVLRRSAVSPLLDASIRGAELETMLAGMLSERSRAAAGLLLHLGCWAFGAVELWVMFALLGELKGLAQALAIDSIVAGLRTFAFMIPAAAGVQEASFVLAGAAFGIPPNAAVAASFARRARDLVLGAATLAIFAGARAFGASRQRQRTPHAGRHNGSASRSRALEASGPRTLNAGWPRTPPGTREHPRQATRSECRTAR